MLISNFSLIRSYIGEACPTHTFAIFSHMLPLASYRCLDSMNDMHTVKQVYDNERLCKLIRGFKETDNGTTVIEFAHNTDSLSIDGDQPRLVAWVQVSEFIDESSYEYYLAQPVLARYVTLKLIKAKQSENPNQDSNMEFQKILFGGHIVKSDFYRD